METHCGNDLNIKPLDSRKAGSRRHSLLPKFLRFHASSLLQLIFSHRAHVTSGGWPLRSHGADGAWFSCVGRAACLPGPPRSGSADGGWNHRGNSGPSTPGHPCWSRPSRNSRSLGRRSHRRLTQALAMTAMSKGAALPKERGNKAGGNMLLALHTASTKPRSLERGDWFFGKNVTDKASPTTPNQFGCNRDLCGELNRSVFFWGST